MKIIHIFLTNFDQSYFERLNLIFLENTRPITQTSWYMDQNDILTYILQKQ